MLARLLRRIYLFQVITGALLGTWLATRFTQPGQRLTLLLIPLGALLLPLLLQLLVIGISMVRSNSGGWGWPWWRAFWGEYRAAVLVFLLRQPWSDHNPGVMPPLADSTSTSNARALPVLLLHGYICNHRVWDALTHDLRQAGHPVLAMDLEPLFTSIDNYAGSIETAVSDLLSATHAAQIAVVCHSMGGLAARAWMREYGTRRVAKVITLGTPHQGTQIAKAAMTPNGAQMEWHSPWLKALQASETDATRHLIHIAWTSLDNIVYPQHEQVLQGAQVTEFRGLGHLEMCLNKAVSLWVLQQLALATDPEASALRHIAESA